MYIVSQTEHVDVSGRLLAWPGGLAWAGLARPGQAWPRPGQARPGQTGQVAVRLTGIFGLAGCRNGNYKHACNLHHDCFPTSVMFIIGLVQI